jgi:hypothetical protein
MADLEITIGDQAIVTSDPDAIPVYIDYSLEDQEDFQNKQSSSSQNVTIPATIINSRSANSFHNPSVEDLSSGDMFKNPQSLVVKARGVEVMVGKALLQEAVHTEVPESYTWNFYGDNADWMIDLADLTLYDFLSHIKFLFTKQIIIDSWQFDGRSENLPYVFAPVRYTGPMGNPDDKGVYDDFNMLPEYMKPSLSKYWLIYWGLKSRGYKIKSEFFDTDFFRRQVMPWSWGAFLSSDSTRIDNLKFLARGDEQMFINWTFTGYWDLRPDNEKTNGGFDNNGVYDYDRDTFEMRWTYLPKFNYGNLDAFLHIQIFISATAADNGDNHMWVEWYKVSNGQRIHVETDSVFELSSPRLGRRDFNDLVDLERKINVNPGDQVIAKIFIRNFDPAGIGRANISAQIEAFELAFFRIPIGTGTIDFLNYTSLKNYKFLDYLRGIIDEFNISVKTDVSSKIVLFEPTHPYLLPGESEWRPGFFNSDFVDWTKKLDLSQKASLQLQNSYNRQINFRYKADSNDTIQKIVQDRYTLTLAASRYMLPMRFQSGEQGL